MTLAPTIYLVDDDPIVLRSLRWMIASVYESVQTYASGSEFLASYDGISHGCVILDMRMPEMTGLDVQARLRERGADLPVIVLTGHGDIPVCTKSFRAGAFDFLVKPATSELLMEKIGQAIAADSIKYRDRLENANQAARWAALTPREKQVVALIVEGKSLKQIASEFQISIQTAAKHRTHALAKLNVENDVELVRIALLAD